MRDKGTRAVRKSDRIVMKECILVESKEITDGQERVGCTFSTEYLTAELTGEQSRDHWKMMHKDRFAQQEIDKALEREESRRQKLNELAIGHG